MNKKLINKLILIGSLTVLGVSLGLIIKNEPKGKDLLISILPAIGSFLIAIGILFRNEY